MLSNICIFFLLCMLGSLFHVTIANASNLNLTLQHQHPEPHVIVRELQRKVHASISRRQLQAITQPNQPQGPQPSCLTGNPIDDCWHCDPTWPTNRQQLANCALGFGKDAIGGRGAQYYIVTSPKDDSSNPAPGTLRHAVMQPQPLWIVFATNMVIKLSRALRITSFKTIDGRGVNVIITGGGCLVIENVSNVIVHNVGIHGCNANKGSDGDGISVIASAHVWIDHCSMSNCKDGLIDVTEGSTAVTISNCYFTNHDKVMLLGHSDDFVADNGMQVTVAFNHFGKNLVQRMPRCRRGYFHVVNNDYTQWKMYAIGGSANPTIYSQGNRYIASENHNSKQVTKREAADEREWMNWEWRTEGDLLLNGAFFVPSGAGFSTQFADDSTTVPLPAQMIDQLTTNSGVFGQPRDNSEDNPSSGFNTGRNSGGDDNGFFGITFSANAPLALYNYSSIYLYLQIILLLFVALNYVDLLLV